jgi:hypothetical protein
MDVARRGGRHAAGGVVANDHLPMPIMAGVNNQVESLDAAEIENFVSYD